MTNSGTDAGALEPLLEAPAQPVDLLRGEVGRGLAGVDRELAEELLRRADLPGDAADVGVDAAAERLPDGRAEQRQAPPPDHQRAPDRLVDQGPVQPQEPADVLAVVDRAREPPDGVVPVRGVEEDAEQPGERRGAHLAHAVDPPVERVHERDVLRKLRRIRNARVAVVVEDDHRMGVLREEVEPAGPGVGDQDRPLGRLEEGGDPLAFDVDEGGRLRGVAEAGERAERAGGARDAVAVVMVDDAPALGMRQQKAARPAELLEIAGMLNETVGTRGHHSTWSAAPAAEYRQLSGMRSRWR